MSDAIIIVLSVPAALLAAFGFIIYRLRVLHERDLDETWNAAYEHGWYAGLADRNSPHAETVLEGKYGGPALVQQVPTDPPDWEPTGQVIELSNRYGILPGETPRIFERSEPAFSPAMYQEISPEASRELPGAVQTVTSPDTWLQDKEASIILWRIREEEKSRNWRRREERAISSEVRDWWTA